MPRLLSLATGIALLAGCWMQLERDILTRIDTMDGHLTSVFDAVNAVQKRDEAAFDAAMKALEDGGKMPGLDVEAQLKLFHRTAKDVSKASDWPGRAQGTTRLLDQCGACHTAHGVKPSVGWDPQNPVENAVWGLVWRSDAHWRQAKLGGDAWEARREAFEKKLLAD